VHTLLIATSKTAVPVYAVTRESWPALRDTLPEAAAAFALVQGFEPGPGKHLLLPGADGRSAAVLVGLASDTARRRDPFEAGRWSALLPEGDYQFVGGGFDLALATLGWLLAAYRFDRYRKPKPVLARLVVPEGVDGAEISRIADAVCLARDLVNTPASDMGPAEIEHAIRNLAQEHGAAVTSIIGDDLLKQNFPMIHAVGRASPRAPRLVDLVWGNPAHPKVTLVGKGVAFDTGGLNLKPGDSMALMKKDMGGSAAAIATAAMVMGAGLPVRLRLLVPAVENAVSGNAFRPGDVLASRKGLSVEIGNTDAEGRLILADALALAGRFRHVDRCRAGCAWPRFAAALQP
jgi:leucyl aminopeptidase